MLNLVKKFFQVLVEITLWLVIIIVPLIGFSIGYESHYRNRFGYGLLGLLLGAVFAMLSCVLVGGVIATFIKIEQHLDLQKQQQQKQGAEIENLLVKIEKHLETQRQNQQYLGKSIIPSLENIENLLERMNK